MVCTQFLHNSDLWDEIKQRVAQAQRVDAAIAYLGQGASKLLKLKKGDRLVVDMSMNAVKERRTDPREIKKLIEAGADVFTRSSLHAKVIVADDVVIAGSANASQRSLNVLDEAGILSTDWVAVRRALEFIDRASTEPVRPEYVKACIKAYDASTARAHAHMRANGRPRSRIVQAKLWFVGGLVDLDLDETAQQAVREVEVRYARKLRSPQESEVTWIRYAKRPKFTEHICDGDWVVQCTRVGKARYVSAPCQVLGQEPRHFPNGKTYHMVMLEWPAAGERMTLTDFRKRVRSIDRKLDRSRPRSQAICDVPKADEILKLWTPRGRIARQKV